MILYDYRIDRSAFLFSSISGTSPANTRVMDGSAALCHSPSEVSSKILTARVRTLSEKDLINYKPYSFITLTKKGKTIAKEVLRRHNVVKDFFQCVLLLDENRAEENACRMEHSMDKIAINRLVQFIEYIYQCPRTGEDWISNFNTFFANNKIAEADCPECLNRCLKR